MWYNGVMGNYSPNPNTPEQELSLLELLEFFRNQAGFTPELINLLTEQTTAGPAVDLTGGYKARLLRLYKLKMQAQRSEGQKAAEDLRSYQEGLQSLINDLNMIKGGGGLKKLK